MSSEKREKLSLEEIEKTQEYQRLTQKQRLFAATYIAGGLSTGTYDAVEATRTAYQCKSAEIARIMSYSLMGNIRIIAVLNIHFNKEPIEEFLVILDRAINNKNLTMAQLGALKMRCDILGFGTSLPNKQSIGALPKDMVVPASTKKPKKVPETKESKPTTKPGYKF